jgi:hypothetical protein
MLARQFETENGMARIAAKRLFGFPVGLIERTPNRVPPARLNPARVCYHCSHMRASSQANVCEYLFDLARETCRVLEYRKHATGRSPQATR